MRSNKELLQVFLNNQHFFRGGLCNWALRLYNSNLISQKEHYLINQIIQSYSIISFFRVIRFNGYWWEAGEIEPRIEFLQKHLS